MPHASFDFKISGENVSPEAIRWRDLAATVSALEKALRATIGARATDEMVFSLSEITRSSAALKITVNEPLLAAAKLLTISLGAGYISALPPAARKAVAALGKLAKERGWSFSFAGNRELGVSAAVISAEHADIEAAMITGGTTILAKVVRVGGEHTPTAQLQLLGKNAGTITVSLPDKEFAKKLGDNLYATRTLHGTATWNAKTHKLESFKAEKIGEYIETDESPQDALGTIEKLSQISPGLWDSIDPDTFIAEHRAD
jgi:hypothetical protein